jgi:hypothetical protein
VVRRLDLGDDEPAVMTLQPAGQQLQRWPFLENPLAVLSRHPMGREPLRDGMAELKVKGLPIRRRWHLVWRHDRALGRPAAAFPEHLRERLGQPAA